MRRVFISAGAVTAASLGVALTATSPAYASYPVTSFGRYEATGTATAGSFTWYNQSVGVQGYVVDSAHVPGGSFVEFDFYQGDTGLSLQTRSANAETTSFNFTQPGPQGGITKIRIRVCPVSDDVGECSLWHELVRP
ncbi:hypothetical protein SAMN05216223_11654 [Actinacidiphila yanglinensis]|uniref:Uncharacterized protein n=1 Tax=Actinacidiphila yanglinensis TaxID=310779 RepID=A0A1H6DJD8_9ACTN|nr:hypothetical protein SAMN05216223_11654 [Actinacidiphila yanglinensis]